MADFDLYQFLKSESYHKRILGQTLADVQALLGPQDDFQEIDSNSEHRFWWPFRIRFEGGVAESLFVDVGLIRDKKLTLIYSDGSVDHISHRTLLHELLYMLNKAKIGWEDVTPATMLPQGLCLKTEGAVLLECSLEVGQFDHFYTGPF